MDFPAQAHPHPHGGWPGNELEEVLSASLGIPSAGGRIVEVLGRSFVWVPLPNGGGPHSGPLDLPSLEIDGQAYVPVFSSEEQLRQVAGAHMAYTIAPAAEFARGLPPQVGIVVNPEGVVGIPLPPPAVAELCRAAPPGRARVRRPGPPLRAGLAGRPGGLPGRGLLRVRRHRRRPQRAPLPGRRRDRRPGPVRRRRTSGARISLLVGFLSAIVAVVIGTVLGVLAGFFGGWVDSLISRVMDGLLAFPQLLFIIALVSVMPNNMLGLTGTGVRLFVMILVIGFFGWPYIGRVVRGQTLSMREREYVEAARSLGAGRFYILFKELLPNLVAPIIVYTTMMIPTNILTEAALSFLGVGVEPHGLVGADALERDRLLRLGPHVHGDPGCSDLHHRARLQPLRRRRA
ncbi:hypothetical protein SVIOM342S_07775 [Streptomyces violaceorubidus]